MIKVTSEQYETEEESWAFGDGVRAGIKAMCKKFNIKESEVYMKECKVVAENETEDKENV